MTTVILALTLDDAIESRIREFILLINHANELDAVGNRVGAASLRHLAKDIRLDVQAMQTLRNTRKEQP